MVLEENTVEPILKPIKRTGRATSTPRRYALIGIAVGAAQRLEWCGLSTAQANKAVAAELRALGIKPTRGKGGVTAGTLRRWREQASEVQPLVRSLPETVLTKLSAVDLGWISASVNAESMTTEKWRTRISALAPAEARRFVLHALERSIVQMILADPPNPPSQPRDGRLTLLSPGAKGRPSTTGMTWATKICCGSANTLKSANARNARSSGSGAMVPVADT